VSKKGNPEIERLKEENRALRQLLTQVIDFLKDAGFNFQLYARQLQVQLQPQPQQTQVITREESRT